MFLLNLTWLQFGALFGAIAAGVVALYLWDRSRRRITVATLRFWTASRQAAEIKHRKRIQQPLSLALQLLAIALLLLALAQLRLGSPVPAARDHVLILDTSAAMAARAGRFTLMEQARLAARAYLRALPAGDRLMLVRADALATPASAFESSRPAVEEAIAHSAPGATALNLDQAFEFARQAQKLQAGRPGEIVYVGPGRCTDDSANLARRNGSNLRMIPVKDTAVNCGLKRIGLRRLASDPDVWEILVVLYNYGSHPRTVGLALAYGGSPAGGQRFTLQPGVEQHATFQYRARGAGWLEARLSPADDFPANDRAVIELPARPRLKVAVYSDEPDLLRPVLAANSDVLATFRAPAEYKPASDADIVILDRFNPRTPPATHAIWIEPPAANSPARVSATLTDVLLTRWRSDHPLASGLRTTELRLESAQVFVAGPEDARVADVAEGPVVLARSGRTKSVMLGFHPVRTAARYALATPLLFANVMRWMSPDIFRRWELNAGSVGTVTVPVGSEVDPEQVRVTANGAPLPHSVQSGVLRFFAATPGTVRVTAGEREMVYSLSLPEVGESRWTPAAAVRRGVPPMSLSVATETELWPWLAAAGAALLMLEWLLFGRGRAPRAKAPRVRRKPAARSRVRAALSAMRGLL